MLRRMTRISHRYNHSITQPRYYTSIYSHFKIILKTFIIIITLFNVQKANGFYVVTQFESNPNVPLDPPPGKSPTTVNVEFIVVRQPLTNYYDAVKSCEQYEDGLKGWTIAAVPDELVQFPLGTFDYSSGDIWVGGIVGDGIGTSGTWQWASGRWAGIAFYDGSRPIAQQCLTYCNWLANSPNDPMNEVALRLGTSGFWNDREKIYNMSGMVCYRSLCDITIDCEWNILNLQGLISQLLVPYIPYLKSVSGFYPNCTCHFRRPYLGPGTTPTNISSKINLSFEEDESSTVTHNFSHSSSENETASRHTRSPTRSINSISESGTDARTNTEVDSSSTSMASTKTHSEEFSSTRSKYQYSSSVEGTSTIQSVTVSVAQVEAKAIPKGVPAEVKRQAEIVAGVVSVAGGMTVGPTAAQLGVAMAMVRMAKCSTEDDSADDSLSLLVHPLAFGVGNGDAAYERGAVLSNCFIIPVGFFLIIRFILAPLVQRLQRKADLLPVLMSLGWPSVMVIPFATLAEGSGYAIASLLLEPKVRGDNMAIALLGLAVIVAVVIVWFAMLVQWMPPLYLRKSDITGIMWALTSTKSWAPITLMERFSLRERGTKKKSLKRNDTSGHTSVSDEYDDDNNLFACLSLTQIERRDMSRQLNLFHCIGDRRLRYAEWVAFVSNFGVGVLEGVPSSYATTSTCRARVALAFFFVILIAGACMTATVPAELATSGIMNLLLAILTVFTLASVFNESSSLVSNDLISSVGACANVIGLVILPLGLVEGVIRLRLRKQQSEMVERFDENQQQIANMVSDTANDNDDDQLLLTAANFESTSNRHQALESVELTTKLLPDETFYDSDEPPISPPVTAQPRHQQWEAKTEEPAHKEPFPTPLSMPEHWAAVLREADLLDERSLHSNKSTTSVRNFDLL